MTAEGHKESKYLVYECVSLLSFSEPPVSLHICTFDSVKAFFIKTYVNMKEREEHGHARWF